MCVVRGAWCVMCVWCVVCVGWIVAGSRAPPTCGEVGGRLFLVRLTTLPPLRAASRVVVPAAAVAGLSPPTARTRLAPPHAWR